LQARWQRRALQLTFPNYQDSPSQGTKLPLIAKIPFPILDKLLRPELQSGLRNPSAAWMLMPEAAMHEDNLSQSRKDKVRSPGKIARMEPIPKPHPVHNAANRHFRAGIFPLDPRHPFASLLPRQVIHRTRQF
jgi:hypothetical protein